MGHFGFSYVGLCYLILLFVPNFLWTKDKPQNYSSDNENKILVILESIGEILVCITVLIFSDFNLKPFTMWSVWLLASIVAMLLYEYWWFRYFKSKKTLKDFYSSLWGIPVAGATLPIIAFFLLGIYGKVIWLLIAVTILAIGHIGVHWQHRKQIEE